MGCLSRPSFNTVERSESPFAFQLSLTDVQGADYSVGGRMSILVLHGLHLTIEPLNKRRNKSRTTACNDTAYQRFVLCCLIHMLPVTDETAA